jgi:hypothetical protein
MVNPVGVRKALYIVNDIDYSALFCAADGWTPETASNHLTIKDDGTSRARNENNVSLGSIETCRKKRVVTENLDSLGTEIGDERLPAGTIGGAIEVNSLDAKEIEQRADEF